MKWCLTIVILISGFVQAEHTTGIQKEARWRTEFKKKEPLNITVSDLKDELKQVVVVTFTKKDTKDDDKTAIAFMKKVQASLAKSGAKTIGYDVGFYSKELREALYCEFNKSPTPVTLTANRPDDLKEFRKLSKTICFGHAYGKDPFPEGLKNDLPIIAWKQIQSKSSRMEIPCFSLANLNRIRAKETLPNLRLRMYDFSEKMVTKISAKKLFENPKLAQSLKGKYVLVGTDDPQRDACYNKQGEQVNGVFFHAIGLAMYLEYFRRYPNAGGPGEVILNRTEKKKK